MLRRIDPMPPNTIGFEGTGEVEGDDWEHVAEPVLREALASGASYASFIFLASACRRLRVMQSARVPSSRRVTRQRLSAWR